MRRADVDVESRGDETAPLMAGTSAPSGGFRDAHLDNCKFFLMCAVVFNHCFQDYFEYVLDPTTGREWCARDPPFFFRGAGASAPPAALFSVARGAYLYLNLLGMPAFTFVSGHCTRGLARAVARGDGSSLTSRSRRAVETLLVPYVIWQTFYLLYNYVDVYPVQAWSPVGVTWYLSALFVWRASVPYLARLRGRVPALFLVGLAVGFTDTPATENGLPFLDFQRLVAFAPFFYLGVESSEARVATIKTLARPWGWIVTLAALACFVVMIHANVGCFDEMQRWVWVMRPYETGGGGDEGGEGASPWSGAARRVLFYVAATFVGAGFASIVPSERTWYTAYGSRTMYAFLLHPLVARGTMSAFLGWAGSGAGRGLWITAAASFVALPTLASAGLMAPWCKRWLGWLVEPDVGWIMWDDEDGKANGEDGSSG